MGAVMKWIETERTVIPTVDGPPTGRGEDSDEPVLTREGFTLIEARAHRLHSVVLPELVEAMQDRESDGRAGHEFDRAVAELRRLMVVLGRAKIAEDLPGDRRAVRLGDEVELRFPDGTKESYRIVHPVEAPLDDRRISAESPLGAAFLGRLQGDVVEVSAPQMPYRCRLVRWVQHGSSRRMVAEVLFEPRRASSGALAARGIQ
jgi:transcription elongation GreA/GreB family factor